MSELLGTQTLPQPNPGGTVPLAPADPFAAPAPQPAPPVVGQQGRVYTQAELDAERERVRKEAHDTVYPERDATRARLQQLEEAARAREAADAKAAEDAAAAVTAEETRKRIEEMSAKEQILEVQRDYDRRLAEETHKREQMEALWQKEAQFNDLRVYRQQVLAATKDNIFPQFWDDLVGPEGDLLSSKEEIDARAATLVTRTQAIIGDVQTSQAEQRRTALGVSPASTPAGYDPMATLEQSTQQLTQDDIRNMSMADYVKNRSRLPTGRTGANSSRGLFDPPPQ